MMAASVYPAAPAGLAFSKVRAAMDVILHVGAHLSGVSTLASYLNRNRRSLQANGLAVWTTEHTRKGLFDGVTLRSGLHGVERRRARGAGRVRLRAAMLERDKVKDLMVLEPDMLGSLTNNLTSERLYPAAGERVARFVHAFGGRVKRVIIGMRALEDYWGGALAHGLRQGHALPDAAKLERLVTQPRSWRKVVMDLACAAPDAEILVIPYERLGARPEVVLGYAVSGRFEAPTNFRLNGLAQVPKLPELREILQDRRETPDALPNGMGRWHPFDAFKVDILREIYVEDLAWLRAGADGLAYLIEDSTPERAGLASRFG
ncbi:hypothetical protein J7413_08615 [Shimia sp. R10_1]|uniref:hypothetical protein n=1 Tax=Shimia sp. R10_1 TaxID=2821095 RepID=UPI001ADD0904|nr:hypothetical protein [Shimia sp. R10_1]MBO9473598.1 hypothetical protein [Shimia sp. R10_1]